MTSHGLRFIPIELAKTAEICVKFRTDSFVASFGNAERFYEADGKGDQRYLVWLQEKIERDPQFAVHVWKDDCIIGQIEMAPFKNEPTWGYIFLYYLALEYRGRGYAQSLDEFAIRSLSERGVERVRLSVSPTNRRAVRFYEKMGWQDKGPRPDHPEVHWMEKTCPPLADASSIRS